MPEKPIPFAKEVPWSDQVTDYDRSHFILYLRLLDALVLGTSEEELCRAVLDLDPKNPHALMILRSHLKRARWMTETGYRELLATP